MSHNLYTINNQGSDVASFHGASLGVLYLGRGESAAYDLTGFTSGDYFEFYDTNPVNTLGATLTQGASAGWYKSFTVPAGTYEIHVNILVPGTGSGHILLRMTASTIRVGTFQSKSATLQDQWSSIQPSSGNGVFTLSTSTTLYFSIEPTSRTPADTGGRMSENSFLFLRKVA